MYLRFTNLRIALGLIGLMGIPLLTQCVRQDEQACTMEFRTLGLQVNDGLLNRHYTLRLSTGDTLFHPYEAVLPGYYAVLTDEAHSWLKGKTEDFRFEGWRNDSLVVQAQYRIGADACHVFKESGPTQWPQ